MPICEAEDTNPRQSRRNVLREPLPNEDRHKNGPEESYAFLLEEQTLPTMHGVEELDRWDDVRIDGPGGVHKVLARKARKPITDEL